MRVCFRLHCLGENIHSIASYGLHEGDILWSVLCRRSDWMIVRVPSGLRSNGSMNPCFCCLMRLGQLLKEPGCRIGTIFNISIAVAFGGHPGRGPIELVYFILIFWSS